jgi:hypothetical protein
MFLLNLLCFIFNLISFAFRTRAVKNGFVARYRKTASFSDAFVEFCVVRCFEIIKEFAAVKTADVMVWDHIPVKPIGRVRYRDATYQAELCKSVEVSVNRSETYSWDLKKEFGVNLFCCRVRTRSAYG